MQPARAVGATAPPPAYPRDRASRIALGCLGGAALGVTTWFGAVVVASVDAQCGLCGTSDCGFVSAVCPSDQDYLAVILLLLVAGAAPAAVALSSRVTEHLTRLRFLQPREGNAARFLSAEFVGPWLALWGAGSVALGLLSPFNNFGNCIEPCVYPYSLTGLPLTLVQAGSALVLVGGAAGVASALRRRRAGARSRPA